MIRLITILIISVLYSCSNSSNEFNIIKNDTINYDSAINLLKKISKLQFHLNKEGKLTQDVHVLTDSFLIENSKEAYNMSKTFLKHNLISDFSFVNYVLPYKVNSAIPGEWRDTSLKLFKLENVNKYLSIDSMNSVCAQIDKLSKTLISYKLDTLDENILTLQDILKRGKGSCMSICDLNDFIGRANGLPVTYDYVPAWGNMNGGHSWNVLVLDKNNFYPINWPESVTERFDPLIFVRSERNGINSYKIPPKIYRRGFIPDTASIFLKYHKELANVGVGYTDEDVTNLYVKTINFNVGSIITSTPDLLVLNIFNSGSWTPVSAISPKHNMSQFTNIGVQNLYMISSPDQRSNRFLFYVDGAGKVYDFRSNAKGKIVINRDRSIVQQQLDFITQHGWLIPDSIKNLSIVERSNLKKQKYILYGFKSGIIKELDKMAPGPDSKIEFNGLHENGVYYLIPEGQTITSASRPFAFVDGRIFYI